MAVGMPFDFRRWIDEHRGQLKPPVGNIQVWPAANDFIVMAIGGPNVRTDYHYEEGEEFFYQLEGDIVVKVIDDGKFIDIPIREGEVFLLPPRMPHSPRRPANTVGLVVERVRRPGEKDGLIWYCEKCHHKLYEEFFPLENIVTQLKPVFDRFYASEELRTCRQCGNVMVPPTRKG